MRSSVTLLTIAASLLGFPALSQTSFLSESNPAQQIPEACGRIDVADANSVYDCLALRSNGTVLTSLRPTDECRHVFAQLAFMVREAQKADDNVTTDVESFPCETAAQVIFDASGTEPYWTSCLGYDPANKRDHFRDCVTAYYVGRERMTQETAAERFKAAGCDDLKRVYYQLAMQAAYKARQWPDGIIRRLPENIEDIDCMEIGTITFD